METYEQKNHVILSHIKHNLFILNGLYSSAQQNHMFYQYDLMQSI